MNVIKDYNQKGYTIVRNVICSDLAKEIENHVYWLGKKYPAKRPEALHHDLLVNDPFIHHVLSNKYLLNIVERFIGPDIALFGAHYIAKKPFDGKPVGWHQDGSYWPLDPMNVVSLWLAATDSKVKNACMRVLPNTHNKKLYKPSEMIQLDTEKFVLDLAIDSNNINDGEAIDIELNAGDLSIHNPFIIHGSNANISAHWRIGLTLRYIPTSTFVNRKNWECILLKGKARKDIKNNYISSPKFEYDKHMVFNGYENYK